MRRRLIVIACLTAAATAWGAERVASNIRLESGLIWVKREVGLGRFHEPRRWLADLPRRLANDPEAAYWLGVCERAEGHDEAALAAWSRVDPASSKGAWASLSKARTLMTNLGRFADAEAVLETLAARPGPARVEARRSLAQLYSWEGRLEPLRRLIESGWGQADDRVGELRNLWLMDSAPPRAEALREVIQRAAKLAPDDDRVWLAEASLATQEGRFADSARRLDACLERRARDPAVWRARLDLARASGDLAGAERALPHLAPEDFSRAAVLNLRAWLAERRGNPVEEIRALEELVDESAGDTQALDRLAALTLTTGRPDRAAELRRRKAEIDQAKDRYRHLLKGAVRVDTYPELAGLAETLGRGFEAEGWWTLAAIRGPSNAAVDEARTRLRARRDRRVISSGQTLKDTLADRKPTDPSREKTGRESTAGAPPDFVDNAMTAGLQFVFDSGQSPRRQLPETMSGGLGLLDFDGDGRLDVYVAQGGPFPPDTATPGSGDRLFRNRGDGTFEDVTGPSGIAGMARGYSHGVTVGDFDNDGRPDLFITRWKAYSLYRNRGDGTFEDATESAGLGGDRDWPTSAAFADLDNDGDLDLYVCHYLAWDSANPKLCSRTVNPSEGTGASRRHSYCMPDLFPALPDHLFRNDGGRFIDVSNEAGIVDLNGRGLGVVAADLDDDGKVDLYVSNDTTANYYFHNLGGLRFEEIGMTAGVACNAAGAFQAGMGVAAGDVDGDGRLDLAVTNFYGESTTFFRNLGQRMFADQTDAVGLAAPSRFLLGFGVALLDVNADGRLDLITANGHVSDERPDFPYEMPTQLLVGDERGRFRDATDSAGPPFRTLRVGRGLATGDLDNNGRTDVVVLSQNSPLTSFHNRTNGGHFLTLKLEGTTSNRDAVGARVVVSSGKRPRTAQRLGGGSYQSASDPRLYFGLGDHDRIDSIEVRWPSGRTNIYRNLPADSGYHLKEGEAEPKPLIGFPVKPR